MTVGPSNRETVKQFQAILAEYGIPSTVRQRRGIDIAAGCGQLRATETPTQHHRQSVKCHLSNMTFSFIRLDISDIMMVSQ